MAFNNFPYTDLQDLNIDWLLKSMKEAVDTANSAKEIADNLKTFVETYFENLDVQQEINNKIDAMEASGELAETLDPIVSTIVAAWLTEHITPTTPPVDNSLTISGAAADARTVGQAFLNSVRGSRQNITESTGTDICQNDLNNVVWGNIYGVVPYTELANCPFDGVGSANAFLLVSFSKEPTNNSTGTQVAFRRNGNIYVRQFWGNTFEAWRTIKSSSEPIPSGAIINITSANVQEVCQGDANNIPNNRYYGLLLDYNLISNMPLFPDGVTGRYGGSFLTFGKENARGYGDVQIFVGYNSQMYVREYVGEWDRWRRASNYRVRNIGGFGDSICEGWRNGGLGFAGLLGVAYANRGVSGATLGQTSGHAQIYSQINAATLVYDTVIMDGGINDYYFNVPLGTVPSSPVTTDGEADALDKTTVCGGLGYAFYLLQKKMPLAARYFIITHKTNNYPVTPNGAGYTQKQLHDTLVQMCDLYNVKVIDVYKDSIINTAFPNQKSPTAYSADNTEITNQYLVDMDGIHPLALGYVEGYLPVIENCIK